MVMSVGEFFPKGRMVSTSVISLCLLLYSNYCCSHLIIIKKLNFESQKIMVSKEK